MINNIITRIKIIYFLLIEKGRPLITRIIVFMTLWFKFDVFECLYETVENTKTIHTAGISFFFMYEHFTRP